MNLKKSLSLVTIAALMSPVAFAGGNKKSGYTKDEMKMHRMSNWNSETIKKAQKKLNAKGFNAGPVDGIYGSQTKQALKDFQRSEGLPVTGAMDREVFETLGVESPQRIREGYSE